jgi:EVE domain
MRYWVGVASRDHVRRGVTGGFCQIDHGRAWTLRKMAAGDRLVYYSPRTEIRGGDAVQAFTAIGEVQAGEPYPYDMGGGFVPFRKDVKFLKAKDAPIRPLLDRLSFTKEQKSWGYAFRRGFFEMTAADYALIAEAMEAAPSRSRP